MKSKTVNYISPLAEGDSVDSAKAVTSPAWFRIGPIGFTRRRVMVGAGVVAAVVAVSLFWGQFDIKTIHAQAERLSAILVIGLICVLPLVGFPVSWLHLAAGLRFDFWPGLAVVAFASATHQTLGWCLVKVLPRRFFTRLEPWRKKLEGAGHRDVTILCALTPGMPYSAQLYLLPVLGVPLLMLCFLSTAMHTARATVTILFGNMSDNLSPGKIALLAIYYAVLIIVSTFTVRRLRGTIKASRQPAGMQ